MTTGSALAFIFTGVIGPIAIVGRIWLEQRMPDPQYERIFAPSPEPALPGGPAVGRPPGPVASIGLILAHPYGRHRR